MESGDSAAGYGDEQDGEHIAGALYIEAGEGGQVDAGIGRYDADYSGYYHKDEKIAALEDTGVEIHMEEKFLGGVSEKKFNHNPKAGGMGIKTDTLSY